MADSFEFATGPCTLPDIGTINYNGCDFSPLYQSTITGVAVKDAAGWTVKYMEYTLTVDGYVTLPDDIDAISTLTENLQTLLSAQGGILIYSGRGFDLAVNKAGSPDQDVAWGPIPEILDFQPLGPGTSAKIKWQVKFHLPQQTADRGHLGPVLQFNEETAVTYDEAGFSTLGIRGTLEIPLTRLTQATRRPQQTVDQFRQRFMTKIADTIDLTRFRVVRREFNITRDKRTLEWDFAAEEMPHMAPPPGMLVARGTASFSPQKSGPGFARWNCTLRATYTVPNGQPRRLAWLAFLTLLRLRMSFGKGVAIPAVAGGNQNPPAPNIGAQIALTVLTAGVGNLFQGIGRLQAQNRPVAATTSNFLIDYRCDEGLYLDSKTVTFSATWMQVATLDGILAASGTWRKVGGAQDGKLWAASVSSISGWKSWLPNQLDPALNLIVDFGGQ